MFTPRHPRTKPELSKVLLQEEKVNVEALCEEAFATMYTVLCDASVSQEEDGAQ